MAYCVEDFKQIDALIDRFQNTVDVVDIPDLRDFFVYFQFNTIY